MPKNPPISIDALSFQWLFGQEDRISPVSNDQKGQPTEIMSFDQAEACFEMPSKRVMKPAKGTVHIILAVTHHGTPTLTRHESLMYIFVN